MNKTYSVQYSNKTVFATCDKTRAVCPLNRLFAPLVNIRVMNGRTPQNQFQCSIVLRGTPAEIQKYMPVAVNMTQQVCKQCQDKKFIKPSRNR